MDINKNVMKAVYLILIFLIGFIFGQVWNFSSARITGFAVSSPSDFIENKNIISIIEISNDENKIDILAYKDKINNLNKGQEIEVTGILKIYRGTLQIEANTIKLI
jgi:hypothetical protein